MRQRQPAAQHSIMGKWASVLHTHTHTHTLSEIHEPAWTIQMFLITESGLQQTDSIWLPNESFRWICEPVQLNHQKNNSLTMKADETSWSQTITCPSMLSSSSYLLIWSWRTAERCCHVTPCPTGHVTVLRSVSVILQGSKFKGQYIYINEWEYPSEK